MIEVPQTLSWWRETPAGAAWLDRLPRLAVECAEQWRLRLGRPLDGGNVALVLAADRVDGSSTVLKINFPEPESEHEADALAHWAGRGAARLLERDDARRALLVERIWPGTPLWSVADDEDATGIAARALRTLWRPPPPDHRFASLAGEADRWARQLPGEWERLGRPFERALVDAAVSFVAELRQGAHEEVVLHQDFHGGNILASAERGWLAIDPKPLVGEPAFDAASLLRDRRWLLRETGYPQLVRRRVDLLCDELGLDRHRLCGWGVVHALAWGVGAETGKVEEDHVECARILLAA